jgi:hypothetical protein
MSERFERTNECVQRKDWPVGMMKRKQIDEGERVI